MFVELVVVNCFYDNLGLVGLLGVRCLNKMVSLKWNLILFVFGNVEVFE